MKKTHKIILVVTVCAVLFSAFTASVFADSINPDTYYWQDRFMPLCTPAYFIYYARDNGNALVEMDTTALVPTETIYNNLGYVEKNILTSDGQDIFCKSTLNVSNFGVTSRSAYGYSYHPAEFSFDFYDFAIDSDTPWVLRMEFNDFFIPPTLIRQDWNWLCNFKLLDYTYGSYLSYDSARIGVTFSYINVTEDGLKMQRVSDRAFDIPGGIQFKSNNFWNFVESAVLAEVPEESYQYGIAVNHINVVFTNPDYENGISLVGNLKYVHPTSVGDSLALQTWQDEFGSVVNEIHCPTILESITTGIEAVMDLELFGLWSIGDIFMACLTVPLCIWLLKLFAGG